MRFKMALTAMMALALAGVFSFAGPSAAQEERDDPELAAKANQYVTEKFFIDYDFFTEINDEGQPRRVHDLVFRPGVSFPMIVWEKWHGDWKTDRFGLDRQRYIGYDRAGESVTNPMFPPDRDAGGVPLESRNWIEMPWDDPDVQAQHYEKLKDKQLDNPDLSDPEIIARMRHGLKLTAGLNGYSFTAETEKSPLYQNPQRYIHVYIPPSPGVWGMGVIFRREGNSVWYMSVPMAPPFPDFAVRLDPPEREAKPGDEVSFTLTVSFAALWDPSDGGRVYLAHKVGDRLYPVPFSLNGRQSQVDEKLGAAYVDVFPGADCNLQTQIAVHAQEVSSAVAAGIVPGWDLGGEFFPAEWYDADLSNNWTQAAIVVNQPNLLVRNLTLDPNPASPGDAVVARAEIVNEGSQDVTTVARWIFNDQVVSEQEVWIPAGGYNVTQAQIQAPEEPGTYAVGVLANPNRDRPANEKTWDDNYAEGYLEVRRLASPGSDGLTLQAWSHPGTDLYGEWQPARKRPVNTAKWSDDVKATLRVARPVPPRGKLDWWEISSARLTYPRQNPDFTFGCPYPPSGTVTVNMRLPGRAGPETAWLEATAEFEENWAMDGFPVYCQPEERLMTTEEPKAYPVTATYTVRYQYSWTVCDEDGCWTETATDSYTRTARQDLLVNGAGTILYGN